MDGGLISHRMGRLFQILGPLLQMVQDTLSAQRQLDSEACDFMLGNPHEMPLPGFVEALQKWSAPHSPDWYGYKENETEPRKVVAESLQRQRRLPFDPEDIFLTNGAFGGLAVALAALLDPGDEVIFSLPPWFFYEAMIANHGGAPVKVRVKPGTFDLDLEAIQRAISPRTRAVIVNTPHNPTGRIYPPETLRGLAEVLTRGQALTGRPVILISDESYCRIVYEGRKFTSPSEFYPYTFVVYTYGKTLLTPGERLGYIALAPQMPDRALLRMALFAAQMVNGHMFPNSLLMHALPDLEQLSIDVKNLEQKRDWMVGELKRMGYQVHSPEGTFYLLPRSPIPDDVAFARLLAERKVFVLPGSTCEWPGYFRISLTASDEMIERGLPVFAEVMKEIQAEASRL